MGFLVVAQRPERRGATQGAEAGGKSSVTGLPGQRKESCLGKLVNIRGNHGNDQVKRRLPCSLGKGSSNPKKDRVAKITRDKIKEIAERKLPDLNAYDIDAAMRIIEGTARSCGITIVD